MNYTWKTLTLRYFTAALQVESYTLNILERGTMVKEIVEVDVDNQTEVIRVPQHNDVAAMEMMNDFKEVRSKFTFEKVGMITDWSTDVQVHRFLATTGSPEKSEWKVQRKKIKSRFRADIKSLQTIERKMKVWRYEGMKECHLCLQNLTVRRIPSTQDCYVSKLDSSIPVPERMEFNMKQVHRFKKLQFLTL